MKKVYKKWGSQKMRKNINEKSLKIDKTKLLFKIQQNKNYKKKKKIERMQINYITKNWWKK